MNSAAPPSWQTAIEQRLCQIVALSEEASSYAKGLVLFPNHLGKMLRPVQWTDSSFQDVKESGSEPEALVPEKPSPMRADKVQLEKQRR